MLRFITIFIIICASTIFAQEIPDRPEKLRFKPFTFQVPHVENYLTRLKNGIAVFIAPDQDGEPLVRIRVIVRGGSYMDPKGKVGLAALTWSQMRDGGTEKLTPEQLDAQLEFLAAELRTNLGDTSSSISLRTLAKDLPTSLDLLMQVLTRPVFSQDRLDLAKKQARQGLERINDSPDSIASYQFSYLLYGENHFSSALPTIDSLDAINREDLKAFHTRIIHPSNLTIIISGMVDRKSILESMNKALGQLKPAKGAEVSPKVVAPDFNRKPGIYVCDKDVPQSTVMLAIPGLRRSDRDWHAAIVMNDILGGGTTGRMMKKLRSDEGLTYDIYSRLTTGTYWRGEWICRFHTKNRSVMQAIQLSLNEIERIKKEFVSDDELINAKDGLINSLPGRFSTKDNLVNLLAEESIHDTRDNFYMNYCEKIQAVTKNDVNRVAQKYFDSTKIVLLIVGKISEIDGIDIKNNFINLNITNKLTIIQLPLRAPLRLALLK